MPMYSYSCTKCDHKFEQIVQISNRDIAQACPACGSFTGIRTLDTTTSKFQLKGDGFYNRTS